MSVALRTVEEPCGEVTALDASGPAMFGSAVAISADGTRLLVGGMNDSGGTGAAWIFRRVGNEWIQQGPKLTPNTAIGQTLFGMSVAMLDSSGSVVMIGAPGDNGSTGAVWAYTAKSNGGFVQQGPKLTASDEAGAGMFGYSIALSADGMTALIGGPYNSGFVGAAWVFTRTANTWSQQTADSWAVAKPAPERSASVWRCHQTERPPPSADWPTRATRARHGSSTAPTRRGRSVATRFASVAHGRWARPSR